MMLAFRSNLYCGDILISGNKGNKFTLSQNTWDSFMHPRARS